MMEVLAPGGYLLDAMQSREWHVHELAQRAGLTATELWLVILNQRAITTSIATGLARAFGTSTGIWIELQQAYDRRERHGP